MFDFEGITIFNTEIAVADCELVPADRETGVPAGIEFAAYVKHHGDWRELAVNKLRTEHYLMFESMAEECV